MKLDRLLSVADFERRAKKVLPRCVYGFVRGGTEDEQSLRANRQAFDDLGFLPRGLNVVDRRDISTELWGRRYAMPLGIAPTGVCGLVRHECDLELARAARQARVPFIISGSSSVPMERLQEETRDNWYQAYFPGDRTRISRILERLSAAKIEVLVVTIDTCVAANRENNARLDFIIPFRMTPRLLLDGALHPRWSLGVFLKTLRANGVPRFANLYEEIGPPITQEPAHGFRTGRDRLSWDDMAWLRGQWKGRLVLKGVMHPQDARKAEELGADGIIVSNHGGRQLDGTIAPLAALPAIIDAVSGAFPVMIDGGFRRGTDVLKAIALGARLVFVGRATLYGAAVAGESGARRVLSILSSELDRNMALLGCAQLSEVGKDLLRTRAGRCALNGELYD